MSKSKNKIAGKAVSYLVLIIGAVVMLVPFIWMVLTSFKTYAEAVKAVSYTHLDVYKRQVC